MVTKEFTFPSVEDLTVEELNLSTASLRAGAFQLGKFCETPSKEYMLCREENKDMRQCLDEGKVLTKCGLDFFRTVKKACLDEFVQFADCLDNSSVDYQYWRCRNTQNVFDSCMEQKLDMPKPDIGYFSRAKILDTQREKPLGYVSPEFPDAAKPIIIPPIEELPPAKYGSRVHWYP